MNNKGESHNSSAHMERHPNESDEHFADRQKLEQRMSGIRHKIVVLSGKGGVGKSTVAVNLAVSLTMAGHKVGLLDTDIHGPSIPTMLGLENEKIHAGTNENEFVPVDWNGMKVVSMGFFLGDQDHAIIWRGPLKMGAIKQWLKDTAWGELDYLIIDSPPGTGDEPLTVFQLLGKVDGAVVVTTPQKVAAVDVRKSISFCKQLGAPVLGVVENMSGFACPKCGEVTQILSAGGGKHIAEDMQVPFLGSIPIDPKIAESGDEGFAFVDRYKDSATAKIMREIIKSIEVL
jgi:ATP-binding protein involved in chromosome partitioning